MRYRAYHPVKYLRCFNRACFIYLDQVLNYLDQDAVAKIIFIRPIDSPMLQECLKRVADLGIPYQADYDDLIFDTNDKLCFAQSSVLKKTSLGHHDHVLYQRALKRFTNVSCSTQHLAKAIQAVHPSAKVTLYRNLLPPEAGNLSPTFQRPEKTLSVYYLSGTLTHQKDFADVIPAVQQWLAVSPYHQLILVGAINIPKGLNKAQVKKIDHRHYLSLAQVFDNALAAIAPLQDTAFNQCKSAIKFLETAHLGIPVICSPYGEYADINSRQGPLLASSTTQWFKLLMRLTTDVDFWQQEAQRQKQGALSYGNTLETNPFILENHD